ncbi:peroxiredoxin-like family protein [Rubripirellula obstinata]
MIVLGASEALSQQTEVASPDAKSQSSLAEQLAAKAAGFAETAPPQLRQAFSKGVDIVRATGIEQSAKQVGDMAVDAKLVGWDGKMVQLSDMWKESPIVLMWYRGGWCPYCNIQLNAMQRSLNEIEGAGAKLVVLTPELPEKAKETAEANNLGIVALHDEKNAVADDYGILFDLPKPILPIYRDKLKMGTYNGHSKMELPLSATYVIDQSGKITYAFLDADYKNRAEPAEVIAAVKTVSGN